MELHEIVLFIATLTVVFSIAFMPIILFKKFFIKVASDKAILRSGGLNRIIDPTTGAHKVERTKTIIGGGMFVWPWQEKIIIDLKAINVSFDVETIRTSIGVLIRFHANAIIKVSSKPELLPLAAEALGEKGRDDLNNLIAELLQGHLREIISTMTPEEVYATRNEFTQQAQEVAGQDLSRFGIELVTFKITDPQDDADYYDSIQRRKLEMHLAKEAEISAEAKVVTEEARRVEIEQFKLTKEKEKQSQKLVELAEIERETKTREERERKLIAIRELEAQQKRALAESELAYPLVEAKRKLEISEIQAKEKEQEGLGKGNLYLKEQEAQAEIIKKKLLAEAEGKHELAKAYAQYDQTGVRLKILEAAPVIIERLLGKDGATAIFGAIAEPMSNINSVNIVDLGQKNDSEAAISRFLKNSPDLVINLLAKLKALGFSEIVDKLGLDSDLLHGLTIEKKNDQKQAYTGYNNNQEAGYAIRDDLESESLSESVSPDRKDEQSGNSADPEADAGPNDNGAHSGHD